MNYHFLNHNQDLSSFNGDWSISVGKWNLYKDCYDFGKLSSRIQYEKSTKYDLDQNTLVEKSKLIDMVGSELLEFLNNNEKGAVSCWLNPQEDSALLYSSLINSIKSNNIMVKLATIKEILVVNFPDLNIQDEQILTAQDPCILISGFSDSVQIQVRMAPKSGTFFTINYLPINSSSKVQFEETIFKLFKVNKVPKGNAYGKYLPYKEKENERFKLAYKDYEKIGEIIKKVLKEFI